MIFKMRRNNAALGVVSRMLNGAEIGHVHILRDYDKAAGVLTGRALNADKPLCKAVLLDLGDGDTALLKVFFYITVGGFFRQRAYRSGAENMIRAEKLLGVLVRLSLILAGEVKVDIRGLFVSRVAEEGLKRDIEAVLPHQGAAVGAVFRRHISAAAVRAVCHELRVFALGAYIMRRK